VLSVLPWRPKNNSVLSASVARKNNSALSAPPWRPKNDSVLSVPPWHPKNDSVLSVPPWRPALRALSGGAQLGDSQSSQPISSSVNRSEAWEVVATWGFSKRGASWC